MKAYEMLAARQWGCISRLQLALLGYHDTAIDAFVKRGRLLANSHGSYMVPGAPPSRRRDLMAACLGSDGVGSNRSAGELWGLSRVRAAQPELLVPGKARPRLGGSVIVHRTNAIDVRDLATVDGIPCTSVPRTILDLGAVLPFDRVESAMEDAVVRLGTQLSALRECLDRLGARGRNGCGVLRTLLDARDPAMAAPQSELELAILRVLRRAGIAEPVRQFWLERRGAPPVCVDLAWPGRRFGIEADSRVWHAGRDDVQRNSEKHNTITILGWQVLRYTWADARARRAAMVAEVQRFLSR